MGYGLSHRERPKGRVAIQRLRTANSLQASADRGVGITLLTLTSRSEHSGLVRKANAVETIHRLYDQDHFAGHRVVRVQSGKPEDFYASGNRCFRYIGARRLP
jgi:hypothetical protein